MQHNNDKAGVRLVFYRTLFSQSAASLTMSSLAAYLRENNIPAELCLLENGAIDNAQRFKNNSEIYSTIIAKPNFKDYEEMFSLLAQAKGKDSTKRIYLCGPYASLNALSIMSALPWIDGVIQGEIEETGLEVIVNGTENITGGMWRERNTGNAIQAPPRRTKIAFDDLPWPARDIEEREQGSYINVEATRGCLHSCSFCHVPLTNNQPGKDPRKIRNPRNVVDEIEYLNKKLRKTLFIFNDPIFWAGRPDDARIMTFCDELKRRQLDIHYYIYLRCTPWPAEELLDAMRITGLVRVFLGVENRSEETLRIYKKGIKTMDFEKAKRALEERQINLHLGYVTFQPYSTLDEIEQNIDFLCAINKLFRLGIILEPVRIVPGSNLHKQLLNDGLIDRDLGYDKITYGYRYQNPLVDLLHRRIRETFEKIAHTAYQFEYHATTGYLTETLAGRINNTRAWLPEFQAFDNAVKESNRILSKYFHEILRPGKKHSPTETDFINQFESIAHTVAICWTELKESITRKTGPRVFKEIYTGLEKP